MKKDRQEIGWYREKGYSLRRIAELLGRSPNTIATELRRNRVRGHYDPVKAHHKAYVRRKYSKYQGKKIIDRQALKKEIDTRLMDDQSPVAVARRITNREKHLPSISKNAIYRYIASVYGRRIEAHRLRKKKHRWRKRGSKKSLSERTFIDRRPTYINERSRIGDVEADFIVSGKSGRGILLTVADRRSRVSFIEQILHVTIPNVHQAFLRIKARFPEMKTMTTDNDLLFERHKELEKLLHIKLYFCHQYHSWEKGTIEHVNGVIRRDIPKGSDISKYSKRFIAKLEAKLNRRPMACLQDRTPWEVLDMHRKRIARNKKHRRWGVS
jgi:IS30 family transposase